MIKVTNYLAFILIIGTGFGAKTQEKYLDMIA